MNSFREFQRFKVRIMLSGSLLLSIIAPSKSFKKPQINKTYEKEYKKLKEQPVTEQVNIPI